MKDDERQQEELRFESVGGGCALPRCLHFAEFVSLFCASFVNLIDDVIESFLSAVVRSQTNVKK